MSGQMPCLLTSATEKRACDNGTQLPIATDINSYAKNTSIPAAKATVRSCVFFYHLLPNIKKKPAIIKHHKKYKKVDFAPAWKTLEYLTLGEVLTLYKNLKSTDDKLNICRHFGIKMTDVFENYIETIRILRNDCAHGSPLFELKLNKSVRKGPAYNDIPQNSQSLKAALDVIHYFINAISPNRAKDLKDEIAKIQNDIKSKNPQLVPILNKSTKMRF